MSKEPLYVATPIRSTGFVIAILFFLCSVGLTVLCAKTDFPDFLDMLLSSICVVRSPRALFAVASVAPTMHKMKIAALVLLSAQTVFSLFLVLRYLFRGIIKKQKFILYPGCVVCSERGADDKIIPGSAIRSVTLNGLNGDAKIEYRQDGIDRTLTIPTVFGLLSTSTRLRVAMTAVRNECFDTEIERKIPFPAPQFREWQFDLHEHLLTCDGKRIIDLRKVRYLWEGCNNNVLVTRIALLDEKFQVLGIFLLDKRKPVLPRLSNVAAEYGITVLREKDFVTLK